MNRFFRRLAVIGCAVVIGAAALRAQPAASDHDARMAWWRQVAPDPIASVVVARGS